MAAISAAAVKALRDKTDLPMMMCKEALTEAQGNEDAAMEILKQKAGKRLDKRVSNATEEGRIFVLLKEDGSAGAMVEIQCESAPVAGGDILAAFGNSLVTQLLNGPGAGTVDELLAQTPAGAAVAFKDQFESLSQKIQEKIVVARVKRVSGPVGAYVHHDGKTAVLFEADGAKANSPVLRDVAMHIAAMKPTSARVEDVDPVAAKAERDRLTAEARQSGKPDNIIEKIVDGKMKVFYREDAGVLTEQAFAKDDSKSVGQVLAEAGLKSRAFTLWILGK